MTRRDLYRFGAVALGGVMTAILAVPGVAYLLDPVLRRKQGGDGGGAVPLARLSELKVGEPKAFPILQARQDAWVKYPPEPVGSVWLIRQPDDAPEKVLAFTAECPHLGCAVNLSPDGKSFRCPCHNSGFGLDGAPLNSIPPRSMDALKVEPLEGDDPQIKVEFGRFVPSHKEKIPLG